MFEVLSWVAIIIAIAAIGVGGILYARGAFTGGASPFFRPKFEPRIDVVEHTAMDAKRRLVLIRRDNIEHLIMTGGPVDVVIETGITPPVRPMADEAADTGMPRASMFSRAPVGFAGSAGPISSSERPPRMAMFSGRRAPPVEVSGGGGVRAIDEHTSADGHASHDLGMPTLKAERS